MPAKKSKKISSAKKKVSSKAVTKNSKTVVSKDKQKAADKKIIKNSPKKIEVKKPAKSTKTSQKIKTKVKEEKTKSAKKIVAKPAPKKSEAKTKKPQTTSKKTETKTSKAKNDSAKNSKSLAQVILSNRESAKNKLVEAKPEPKIDLQSKANEKKFDSNKKAIIVRKSEDGSKLNFKVGDYAIYPSHGVGKIVGIEKNMIMGQEFSCYLMDFEREKLTIKIPANSAKKIGLRHPISKTEMDEVFVILRSGVKKLKGMWSRRAQEYETKINSGDIILLAEVIRDLTRDIDDAERSYSERIIYETAIYRLASEYAAIYKIDFEEAKEKVVSTAKDKLAGELRANQKDDFDDFDDFDLEKSESDDEEDEENEDDEDEEEEDEDDDFDYDDDDDDAPKKRKKKR
jgi:CarD family transcriptional regulator